MSEEAEELRKKRLGFRLGVVRSNHPSGLLMLKHPFLRSDEEGDISLFW